jgi:hypothetical protein
MSSERSIELATHRKSVTEREESTHSGERQPDGNGSPEGGEFDGQALEPADGGFSAWKILLSAFAFEAVLWGKWAWNTSAI